MVFLRQGEYSFVPGSQADLPCRGPVCAGNLQPGKVNLQTRSVCRFQRLLQRLQLRLFHGHAAFQDDPVQESPCPEILQDAEGLFIRRSGQGPEEFLPFRGAFPGCPECRRDIFLPDCLQEKISFRIRAAPYYFPCRDHSGILPVDLFNLIPDSVFRPLEDGFPVRFLCFGCIRPVFIEKPLRNVFRLEDRGCPDFQAVLCRESQCFRRFPDCQPGVAGILSLSAAAPVQQDFPPHRFFADQYSELSGRRLRGCFVRVQDCCFRNADFKYPGISFLQGRRCSFLQVGHIFRSSCGGKRDDTGHDKRRKSPRSFFHGAPPDLFAEKAGQRMSGLCLSGFPRRV